MHDQTHRALAAAIAHTTDREPAAVEPHHRLEADLGLDPLDIALVALATEDALGVEIDLEELPEQPTVAALTALFRAAVQDEEEAAAVTLRSADVGRWARAATR